MQLKPFIAAAGLTASAVNAFLLPPDVSVDDIVTTLPVPVQFDEDVSLPKIAQTQNLKLNCPGCPIRVRPHWKSHHEEASIKTDIPSHLELDFSIATSDSPDGVDRLLLNGFELYPKSNPFQDTLTAALLPDLEVGKMKLPGHIKGPPPHHLQNLGFGLQTRLIPSTDDDDDLELVMVDLQVIEVGDAFVDGIPNVEIKLVKSPSGKLMIADLAATESENVQTTPMDSQEECTTMFCKWIAMAKEQFGRFRSGKHCGGRPGHAGQESGHMEVDMHRHREGRPHHEHRHRWGHLLKNIATHILLPVAIGIMAGVTASILGMMVGTFIVYLWRTFVRRPSSRRQHHGRGHKAGLNEAVVEDEKSGLMSHQEVEAPPAYVEEGVLVADDKKPEDSA
ncbi:hypothetical protein UCREL1_6379 [Eutypa lata UCREL1]|uniref:DUF7728 domain-containing protein n=1 Tax=Eutypa lata (strain UCR-EL1) TaxID=1287681 RepID=M7SJX4_EUTLA|nr:hypothetical protein UCREL1_6379 [Eutypa lata UCREL1]